MADKRFVVLGLGSFGTVLAQRLTELGCRVTGVDADEDRIEALKDRLYEAIEADVTDRAVLEQLSLKTADAVFISLGEDIERSILASLHTKELGARQIYVKGVTKDHGKILRKLEVTRVIFPEEEIALQTAERAVYPNVLESVAMGPEYSIAEVVVPPSLVGKRLVEAELPRRYHLMVLGVKEALAANWEMSPGAEHRFSDEQLLLVMGKPEDINAFSQMS